MVGKPGETGQAPLSLALASPPRSAPTDCFCLRQTEPEAEGQAAHLEAQNSSCDHQAHQSGPEADHHLCPNHRGYEDGRTSALLEIPTRVCPLTVSLSFVQRVDRSPGKTRSSSNRSRPPTSTLWERRDTQVGGRGRTRARTSGEILTD